MIMHPMSFTYDTSMSIHQDMNSLEISFECENITIITKLYPYVPPISCSPTS